MQYEQFNHSDKNIFLVNMQESPNYILSKLALKGIDKYNKKWKKIALILNQKWHSKWLMCKECGHIHKCSSCDIPIGIHLDDSNNYFGICHICKKQYNIPSQCWKCNSPDIISYWYGLQKVKQILQDKLSITPHIIYSSKTNSSNKTEKTQNQIKKNNIILWTSILSTPIQNTDFELIIFINADKWLNIPDFNSNFSTFVMLYETIKNHQSPNYIIQSYKPDNYVIKNICNLDFDKFQKKELKHRKQYGYPPFGNFCIIHHKNKIEKSLFNKVNKLSKELKFLKSKYELSDLEIYSTPPLIYKKYWKYRYNIILKWPNLKQFMDIAYSKLKIPSKNFKINFNPKSLI